MQNDFRKEERPDELQRFNLLHASVRVYQTGDSALVLMLKVQKKKNPMTSVTLLMMHQNVKMYLAIIKE